MHVTTPPLGGAQVQPVPLPAEKVVPVGTGKETETPLAGEGPALLAVAVYVRVPLAFTDAGSVSVNETSAEAAVTVVDVVALLFAPFGSAVVAETEVEIEYGPGAAGAVAETVMAGAAPTASDTRVQVTVVPATEQLQPVPEAERLVKPAGRVWVRVTLLAVEGPALLGERV